MAKFSLYSRRRGVALLTLVLVGFVVLSIVGAVAMNIAGQTVRNEAFLTQGIKERRLDALARSAAIAVAEAVSADGNLTAFGASVGSGVTSNKKLVFSDPTNTYLVVELKGKQLGESLDFTITSTATASSDKGGKEDKASLTLTVVRSGDEIIQKWGKGK